MANAKRQAKDEIESGKRLGGFLAALDVALTESNEAAREDLSRLRRRELEHLPTPIAIDHRERFLSVSRQPMVTVESVQFPQDWLTERIQEQVVQAARAWVLASHKLSQELVFAITSDGPSLRLGFSSVDEARLPQEDSVASRLRAAFPGISFCTEATVSDSAVEIAGRYGAACLLTGIPCVVHNDVRQLYSLDRLIRGMRGRPFSAVVSARRVPGGEIRTRLDQYYTLRAENWERIRQNITDQIGEEEARTLGLTVTGTAGAMSAVTSTVAKSVTKALTKALSGGGNGTVSFCSAPMGVGLVTTVGGNAGGTRAGTDAESTTTSESNTSGRFGAGSLGASYSVTKSRSRSLSSAHEELNAFAEALDAQLQDHIERMRIAETEGAWEVACYVLGATPADAELAGALWCREMTGEFAPVEPVRLLRLADNVRGAQQLSLPVEETSGTELYTVLTSSELAAFINLPTESQPGIEVRQVPRFAVNFPHLSKPGATIDLGSVLDRDVPLPSTDFALPTHDLAAHTLVAGITGSGKTTTVKRILTQAGEVPWLVVEPAKAEYRSIVVSGAPVRVYTAGDEWVSPFRINPFELPEDGNLIAHMDALAEVINSAFPMEGPMAALVEQAVVDVYRGKGWDVELGYHPELGVGQQIPEALPTMDAFHDSLAALIDRQGYAGDYGSNIRAALLTRIRSLCCGSRGRMLNTAVPLDVAALLRRPTVVELRRLGSDETRAFLMGLLLYRLYKHFEHESGNTTHMVPLRALVVIEEAHRLCHRAQDRAGALTANNIRYRSVELFESIMAEARAYGLGLVVVDQLPLRLSEGATKNTATKLIHRLSASEDAVLSGGAMGLDAEDAAFITRLRVGEVLVHRSDMERPAHVRIPPPEDSASAPRGDSDIADAARAEGYTLGETRPPDMERVCSIVEGARPEFLTDLGDRFLFSLLVGRLDDERAMVGGAEDHCFTLGREAGVDLDSHTAAYFIRRGVSDVLDCKWYLRVHPKELHELQQIWSKVWSPSTAERVHTLNGDAVLALRRAMEAATEQRRQPYPALLVADAYAGCRRFALEACSHAAAIVRFGSAYVQALGSRDPFRELFGLAVAQTTSRAFGQPKGRRVADYAFCLWAALIECAGTGEPTDAELLEYASRCEECFCATGEDRR